MTTHDLPALTSMVRKLATRSPLGSAGINALLALPSRVERLNPGAFLVREGDKSERCITLLSGFAYGSKVVDGGGRQILSLHVQGDLMDLQNSLLDEADHSLQALTPVDVAYISHAALMDVATAYPAVALALWRDTLINASLAREWIVNLGRRNARQRICHLLCELALRQQAAGICDGPHYHWPMTQEQIGDATGLTSVHVNRTMRGIRDDGLITTTKHAVSISDWSRLQREGDFRRAYLHEPAMIAA